MSDLQTLIEEIDVLHQAATAGEWTTELDIASSRIGQVSYYHAIRKGLHRYTVAYSDHKTGDVVKTDLKNGMVRKTLVNTVRIQPDIHVDAALIVALKNAWPRLRDELQKANKQ